MVLMFLLFASPVRAQSQDATVDIEVRTDDGPVGSAEVFVNGVPYTTDSKGIVSAKVTAGTVEIVVAHGKFAPVKSSVQVQPGQRQQVIIELEELSVEVRVTVSATRTDTRLEDLPMRVEVLAREEIEEKMMMTPGDVVMMLNETGGLRVQATSPSLGAASVRIQGMRGRYTRFLSDGLPLFGEQVGGLGLLQIPPMDLGQVEVIKGVASALYGSGAMGGVVNLISRRAGSEPLSELLVNRSTRGATDAVAFIARSLSSAWSTSILASGHWQERTDVNDDAWADLPGYSRGVLRPRVFWDDRAGRSFFATAGITYEDRQGGTLDGLILAPAGAPYVEALDTLRFDVGALGQTLWRDRVVITARGAAARQRHDHVFGAVLERDRHDTLFGELAVRTTAATHTLVGGVAVERDGYRPRDVSRFAYTFTVPGVFVQDDIAVAKWLSLSASGRVDVHSEYGTFASPRVSALVRGGGWTSRLSLGAGFFGPTPLTEESEAAGLSRLTIPAPLKPERGRSMSFDLTRAIGPASFTATFFGSRILDPIRVDRSDAFILKNADEPTTNGGIELLGTLRREPLSITGTYTYVKSRETDGVQRLDVPLTPRHSAGIVGFWEGEGKGRVGAEIFYTGPQRLEENPFLSDSRAYLVVGVLAERRIGPVRVFVNGENLTDARQTRWSPLLRPTRAPDGRWTVDAWAPLEGRVINGGVRVQF